MLLLVENMVEILSEKNIICILYYYYYYYYL